MTNEHRDFAKKQITRMGMLVNFPQKFPPAIEDLIDALMTATDEPMAKAVVDAFLEEATADTRCPMASEIKSAVKLKIRGEGTDWLADPDCPTCGGSGDIRSERGGYSYSKACGCMGWRLPPDYSKMKREPFDVSEAVRKLKVQ